MGCVPPSPADLFDSPVFKDHQGVTKNLHVGRIMGDAHQKHSKFPADLKELHAHTVVEDRVGRVLPPEHGLQWAE